MSRLLFALPIIFNYLYRSNIIKTARKDCKETHRVYTLSINPCFKVKVTARRISRTAYKTDHLALLYPLTWSHTDSRTVRIKSLQPISVINLDVVAVATAPGVDAIGDGHCSIGRRQNGCSRWGCNVCAIVVFYLPGERVFSVAKMRCDCEALG